VAVSIAIVEWPFNGPGNELAWPSGEEANFPRRLKKMDGQTDDDVL